MRFIKKVETADFIEFSEVYGHLYGTTADSFRKTKEGLDVIKLIDVQGAEKLRKLNIDAKFIFFEVPLAVLKKRLEGRGESETLENKGSRGTKELCSLSVKERLSHYNEELKYKKHFDFIVDTSGTAKDIQKNVKKVIQIMDSM